MIKLKFLIPAIFFILIFSCEKEQKNRAVKSIQDTTVKHIKRISEVRLTVDTFSDSLVMDKFGYGCMASYSKKGTNGNDNIFMEGAGIPAEIGKSLTIMKIDGTLQLFHSIDEKDVKSINENLFKTKLSNKDYEVEITTHLGESFEASDSTEHYGTIKVTRKKDKSTITIDFEGGVAC